MSRSQRRITWVACVFAWVVFLAVGSGKAFADGDAATPLRVPSGFRAAPGTGAEPYTHTGWAKEVIHDKTGLAMTFVPAGEFRMGSPSSEAGRESDEGPVHTVRITKPFYLGKYEVTVEAFWRFVQAKGYRTEAERGEGAFVFEGGAWIKKSDASWRKPYFSQTGRHPVVCVSWNDAKAFCDWAGCRLPTEAQWEYACRAGGSARFGFGDDDRELYRYGNYADRRASFPWSDKERDDGHERAAPAGGYLPNAWGLYDMHGNVWEWCADWYGSDYYRKSPEEDPPGPRPGSDRVNRSGSWHDGAGTCRSALRMWYSPGNRGSFLGFRLARTIP